MVFIIIILILIVIGVMFLGSSSEPIPNTDETVKKLESYYDLIREKREDLGVGVVVIGTRIYEKNGEIDRYSEYLAVSLHDVKNVALAKELGMKANVVQGKTKYEFVLEGRFPRDNRYDIVGKLAKVITNKYPDDIVDKDNGAICLYSTFDCGYLKAALDQYAKLKK